MERTTLVLPHPLSCLTHADTFTGAEHGVRWRVSKTRAKVEIGIGLFTFAFLVLVIVFLAIMKFLRTPTDASMSIVINVILLSMIVTGLFVSGELFYRAITQLRELNTMQGRRLPEEALLACDLFLAMNADLARLYRREIRPFIGRPLNAGDPEGCTRMQNALDELCRIDGVLYEVSQANPTREARSAVVKRLQLQNDISRLIISYTPPRVPDVDVPRSLDAQA